MGCGDSKSVTVTTATGETRTREKTPSRSSSSGVSSYRHSQTLQPDAAQSSQDLHQNRSSHQDTQEPVNEENNQQLLAEQQRRDEEAEAERRLHEKACAEEEERHRQEEAQAAEAARHQQEANQQGVITEQNEGQGSEQKEGGRFFSPLEIAQHNAEVKWIEWIPHKGKVYDGNGVRNYFPGYMDERPALLEARARQRVAEGAEEDETDFVTFVNHVIPYWTTLSLHDPLVWMHHGIVVLRSNGISEEELAKELPPFLLGTITSTSDSIYFDSLRRDISTLLEELRGLSEDSKSSIVQDYEAQLTRWKDKYSHMDPEQSPASDGKDPNEKIYPLPVDPDSLRLAILEGEELNFEVPPEGAWQSCQLEETIDLGDPHEIFSSSLRVHFATEELLFDIEGEVAWEVLPDNAVKEEMLTAEQEETQAAREKRTDLTDPERMKTRRQQLCHYFIEVRELPPDVVTPFLQWASITEAGQAQLDKLCQEE